MRGWAVTNGWQFFHRQQQPDGTPRKLMDVRLINSAGWMAGTPMSAGLATAYAEFRASIAHQDLLRGLVTTPERSVDARHLPDITNDRASAARCGTPAELR